MKNIKKIELFDIFNYFFLSLFAFITLYPFIYVVAGAFSDGLDYMRGGIYFFPRQFSIDNFRLIFNDNRLLTGFTVTITRTVLGTFTGIMFTSIVAYAMSRSDLPYRKQFYWFNIFTLYLNAGLIPLFVTIKYLGLFNNFLVYIIPTLYSVFNMIILSNFFKAIPEEIHDSALIDGAGEFRILMKLYLPLSKPALATVALWVGVFHWNSFFDSMVFTTDSRLQTLQFFLVKLIKEASFAQGEAASKIPAQVLRRTTVQTARYAAIVVSTVPILLVYPFMQKYLVKGVMLGSVKG